MAKEQLRIRISTHPVDTVDSLRGELATKVLMYELFFISCAFTGLSLLWHGSIFVARTLVTSIPALASAVPPQIKEWLK